MREIKFRAWDAKNKKMHQNVSPWRWDFVISNSWHRCEKSTGAGILGSGGDDAEMLVPAVRYDNIMQFTGMKDKNEKDIYECDIIKLNGGADDVLFDVDFEDGCFVARVPWRKESSPELKYYIGFKPEILSAEIVGNIYEHPELLNSETNDERSVATEDAQSGADDKQKN